ncbi:SCO family protein [Halobacteriales archaeon QH_2_65_14]|nr:MAG: SCO family protein [Halobacteriales archaeon QH_2_65_14]
MRRRTFLGTAAVSAGVALAGCIGDEDGNPNTVLGEPDREVDVDAEALAYPAYGQELPTVSLPAPLHGEEVATTEYVGEGETLVTFVFTRCPGPCPGLTAVLAHVQSTASEESYADEVALMPMSFDPEHDTDERIREFSELNGADPDADNWLFLRPETPQRAQEVVHGTFGVGFEEVPGEDGGHDGHDQAEQGEPLDPGEHDDTTFVHTNLLLLVNRDGYVERTYTPQPPRPDEVLDDLEAVRDRY